MALTPSPQGWFGQKRDTIDDPTKAIISIDWFKEGGSHGHSTRAALLKLPEDHLNPLLHVCTVRLSLIFGKRSISLSGLCLMLWPRVFLAKDKRTGFQVLNKKFKLSPKPRVFLLLDKPTFVHLLIFRGGTRANSARFRSPRWVLQGLSYPTVVLGTTWLQTTFVFLKEFHHGVRSSVCLHQGFKCQITPFLMLNFMVKNMCLIV